jgi:GT2 family glycosyltransferase
MKMMYDLAIIIINYNSSSYTLSCIASIKKYTANNYSYQIIVVDNASADEDFELLSRSITQRTDVQIIRNEKNLGFAGGNMKGAAIANARYLFFLNNDTLLLNDCITLLSSFMDAHPQVGICTAQMYNSDSSFHFSFTYHPTAATYWLGTGLLKLCNPDAYPSKKKVYTKPLKVDVVTGAALFVRKNAFDKVGGFDTAYFLYCEEEDLCKQMANFGYDVYLVPEAKFIHHGGSSTKPGLPMLKENAISKLIYHRKFASKVGLFMVWLYLIFKNLKKGFKHKDYLRLTWFIIKGAPPESSLRFTNK